MGWRVLVVALLAAPFVDCSDPASVHGPRSGAGGQAVDEAHATPGMTGGAAVAGAGGEAGVDDVAAGAGGVEAAGVATGTEAMNDGGQGGVGSVAPPDRFLVFEGWNVSEEHTEVWGVPLRSAGQQQPTLLSDGSFTKDLPLSSEKVWSPDGRFLVFDAAWTDFQSQFRNRFFYLDFSGGSPSPARPLPDLPRDFPVELGHWDASSRILTFTVDSTPYVVDFSGQEPATRLVETPEEPTYGLRPCRDGSAFLQEGTSSTWLLGATPGAAARDLGATEATSISSDGRWLALQRETDEGSLLSLRRCDLSEGFVEIGSQSSGAPHVIASSSRYLATTLMSATDDEEVVVVDLESGKVIARHAGGAAALEFSGSNEALLIRAEDDSYSAWRFADDQLDPLPLPWTYCEWAGDRALCEWSELADDDELRTTVALLHPFQGEEPVTLQVDATNSRHFMDASESWLSLTSGVDEPRLLQVNLANPELQTLTELGDFGSGDYWIQDADADGGTLVQRQLVAFELLSLSPGFAGVLYGSQVPAVASIQP